MGKLFDRLDDEQKELHDSWENIARMLVRNMQRDRRAFAYFYDFVDVRAITEAEFTEVVRRQRQGVSSSAALRFSL